MLIERIEDINPVDAFLAVSRLPNPFIFGGAGNGLRRYSYVGADPVLTVSTDSYGKTAVISGKGRIPYQNPFDALSETLAEFRIMEKGPFPFNGGFAGYLSYNLK